MAKRTGRPEEGMMLVQSSQLPEAAAAWQSFPPLLGKVVAAGLKRRSLTEEVEAERKRS